MTTALDPKEFQARLARLEQLISQTERFGDARAQSHTRQVVQAVLELHGIGLERILEHMTQAGEAGRDLLERCAGDDVAGGLLLLHGLHPLDLEARVQQALESVRPYLRSHAGNVELVAVDGDVVRLRLEGSCDGCPSSAVTMRQTIERAIYEKAPDVSAIEVDGLPEPPPPAPIERSRVALPLVANVGVPASAG
jgi:Fe-S cluster biogenesis protein NfuA